MESICVVLQLTCNWDIKPCRVGKLHYCTQVRTCENVNTKFTTLNIKLDFSLVTKTMHLNMINLHTLIFSSRSKDIVEPLIKPQWYVDFEEMADMAVKVHKALSYHVYFVLCYCS